MSASIRCRRIRAGSATRCNWWSRASGRSGSGPVTSRVRWPACSRRCRGRRGPVALLLSSDEEAGSGSGVGVHRAASIRGGGGRRADAVLGGARASRGSGRPRRCSPGSAAVTASRALADSAVHEAIRWAGLALEHSSASEAAGEGLRLNIRRLEGGQKANIIAANATLRFGVRPPPGLAPQALARLFALATESGAGGASCRASWRRRCRPRTRRCWRRRARAGGDLATRLGVQAGAADELLDRGGAVLAAGATALVFGPGDIAQAHAAGEWVALAELAAAATSIGEYGDRREEARPCSRHTLIVKLLRSLGGRKEVEQYLERVLGDRPAPLRG